MPADTPSPDANYSNNQPSGGQSPPSGNAPGVYVRQQHNPNELDMLWSGSRQFHKEDRSPVIFTAAGLVLGIVITSALFFLFTQKPEVTMGDETGVETASDSQLFAEENGLDFTTDSPPSKQANSDPSDESSAATMLDRITGGFGTRSEQPAKQPQRSAPATPSTAPAPIKTTLHAVRSGDTLGRIALKYYGNSGPSAIGKLVSANNLANPDDLSIGQELVIPQ